MKNLTFIAIICLCLTACICKNRVSDNSKYMCGAYTGNRAITDDDIKVFDTAYSYKTELTPRSVSTQVVAGINYRFICTDKENNEIAVVIFKPLPNHGEPRVTAIELVSGNYTPEFTLDIVQNMYDDIRSVYNSGENGQKYAFSRYASSQLRNLMDEVDSAITSNHIPAMIYGWDCDLWIMAQDWINPTVKVLKINDFKGTTCHAEVTIGETKIELSLINENGKWKVDDFINSDIKDSFAKALKADYEAARISK